MNSIIIILISITIGLTFIASIYAGSETAISSAGIPKLKLLINQSKNKKLRSINLAIKLIRKYTISLTAIIIANNLIIISFTSVITLLFIQLINNSGLATIIALIYGTIVLVIFGEILPKWLGRKYPEKWTILMSWILQGTIYILYPIVKLLNLLLKDFRRNTASEPELIEIVKSIQKEGVIETHEGRLVTNAIKFDDKTADSILIPWDKVTYVTNQYTNEAVLRVLANNNFQNIPIIDGVTENAIGVLNAKVFYQLLHSKKHFHLQESVKIPTFVSSKVHLDEIIKKMQQGHSQFCIVYNEENQEKIVGIITIDDLMSELVGDISLPQEQNDVIIVAKKNKYIVDCKLNWNTFCQSFPFNNWNLKANQYKNVLNWYKQIKVNNKNNKKIKFQNFTIKLKKINKKDFLIFSKIPNT